VIEFVIKDFVINFKQNLFRWQLLAIIFGINATIGIHKKQNIVIGLVILQWPKRVTSEGQTDKC
jgi:hypothetical protein